jgi:ABC-type amino acid transport substrate-binding protein
MRTLLIAVAALLFAGEIAAADTLDRIKDAGVFRIGYRTDAAPFAYDGPDGEPAGYAVDLCREVAAATKERLSLETLKIEYVTVNAEDRFEAVKDGRVDILCDPATITLSRREIVDFSLMTFVDGASVLFRIDGPQGFEALAGQKVGVHADTTTETKLRNSLETMGIDAEILPVETHDEGLKRLASGELAAYFADRSILIYLLITSDARDKLKLSDQYYSMEPYGLAVARGDEDFLLLVDRTLAQLYRSGKIASIFAENFGNAEASDLLKMMFSVNALGE